MIILIAAIADNNVIGIDNDLPWYLPEDLLRFKKLTTGNTVVMGRKTYESIHKRLGKPLPERTNVVLTTQQNLPIPPSVELIHDISEIKGLKGDVYIIGGSSVFEQALPLVEKLEITEVHSKPEGDAHFPQIDWNAWKEIMREDEDGYSFVTYTKK